jgi:hypothetical protein
MREIFPSSLAEAADGAEAVGFKVEVEVVPALAVDTEGLEVKPLVELLTVGFAAVVEEAVLTGAAVTLARTGLVVPSFAAVVRDANGLLVDEANELRTVPAVAEDDPGAKLDLLTVVPAMRLDSPFAAAGFFSLPDAS